MSRILGVLHQHTGGVLSLFAAVFFGAFLFAFQSNATHPFPANAIKSVIQDGQLSVLVSYWDYSNHYPGDHIHLQIDDGPVIHETDFDGSYRFTNVSLGEHVLKAFYADVNHNQMGITYQMSFSINPWDQVSPTPTPTPSGSPCHQYIENTSVPSGFGSPADLISPVKKIIMRVECSTSAATVKIGSGSELLQYIYHQGYVSTPVAPAWQQVSFTGSGEKISDAWYKGSASITVPLVSGGANQTYYVLGYVCTWTGSAWKCGCRDTQCTQNYWQIQQFKSPVAL